METHFIVTLTPECSKKIDIQKFIDAGATMFRLCGNNDTTWIRSTIERMHAIQKLPCMLETQGARMIPMVDINGYFVEKGDLLTLSWNEEDKQKKDHIYISGINPLEHVHVGDEVIFHPHNVLAVITAIFSDRIKIEIKSQGLILAQHMSIPRVSEKLPLLIETDHEIIDIAKRYKIEYLALSFVRKYEDIVELKENFKSAHFLPKILARMDCNKGFDNSHQILSEVDGLMLTKGCLQATIPWYARIVVENNMLLESKEYDIDAFVVADVSSSIDQQNQIKRETLVDITLSLQLGIQGLVIQSYDDSRDYTQSCEKIAQVVKHASKNPFPIRIY